MHRGEQFLVRAGRGDGPIEVLFGYSNKRAIVSASEDRPSDFHESGGFSLWIIVIDRFRLGIEILHSRLARFAFESCDGPCGREDRIDLRLLIVVLVGEVNGLSIVAVDPFFVRILDHRVERTDAAEDDRLLTTIILVKLYCFAKNAFGLNL